MTSDCSLCSFEGAMVDAKRFASWKIVVDVRKAGDSVVNVVHWRVKLTRAD